MNEKMKQLIEQDAKTINAEVISNRRYLHMHPETGYDTKESERFIKEKLTSYGIETTDAKTGVMAVIEGRDRGKMIALRADMDALPIQEENDVPYCSRVPGKMHACGHDAHTAMLLGAAEILKKNGSKLPCDVLLIFQPAEEGPSPGGAKYMVEEIIKKGWKDKILGVFAQHVQNSAFVGQAGYKYGALAASTDEYYVTIQGKGGHAGRPQNNIDALSIGARIIGSLEAFMSRRMDPLDSAVMSTGRFRAGEAINVVADRAEFAGTIRCLRQGTREVIVKAIRQISESTCAAFGATCECRFIRGLNVLYNAPHPTDYVRDVLTMTVGKEKTVEITTPMMGAEDFSYFAEAFPASYIWLGSRGQQEFRPPHQPHFDIDEGVLDVGVRLMANIAMNADSL